MTKLLKYLKNYKKEPLLGPFFKLLEAVFELIVPLVMAKIIDVGIKNSDFSYVLKMGGIMLLLGAVGLCFSLTCQYYAAKAAFGFGTELRHEFFRKVNDFSFSELDKFGTPTLVTRMLTDIQQAQNGVNMAIRLGVRVPFLIIGSAVMAFMIDAKMALIFVAVIPLLVLVLYIIVRFAFPLYRKIQKQLDAVTLKTREALSGARVVRAFSKEKAETEKFDNISVGFLDLSVQSGKIWSMLNPMGFAILNLAAAAILWLGGNRAYNGNITQGDIAALVNYMTQISLALIVAANVITIFIKANASAERVAEVIEEEPKMRDGTEEKPFECETALEFKNVSFSYNGSEEYSLKDISVTLRRGETLGVIGGTGSGKTTFVNLISRYYDCSAGDVLVNGINVKDYKSEFLRQKIGTVPQRPLLFSGTVRTNMQFANPDITDDEIKNCLETAQAADFIFKREEGIDAEVLQNGRNFSGGQRQRLTIARALAAKPEILILDDSSSALDYATEAELRKSLNRLKDVTVILVAQRTNSVRFADKILVLDDGECAGIGTHAELLENCAVYREIYQSQEGGAENE